MQEPEEGDRLVFEDPELEDGGPWHVIEIHHNIHEWWNTEMGENKVAMMDCHEMDKLEAAEWFAMVQDNSTYTTMCVADFEVKSVEPKQ